MAQRNLPPPASKQTSRVSEKMVTYRKERQRAGVVYVSMGTDRPYKGCFVKSGKKYMRKQGGHPQGSPGPTGLCSFPLHHIAFSSLAYSFIPTMEAAGSSQSLATQPPSMRHQYPTLRLISSLNCYYNLKSVTHL